VGPALTFAFREATFALSYIEEVWIEGEVALSHVRHALEDAMLADPSHWQGYYGDHPRAQRFARQYSFSDRLRYYWPAARVQAALQQLLENLSARPIPLTLLSQFLPEQYRRVRDGRLANNPHALMEDKIGEVLADYAYASGFLVEGRPT
jgi:D-tagatose-1,6-bisphosphate aldolase subunit GatZ/KbaZ